MVRLKECARCQLLSRHFISIPYGAIKSKYFDNVVVKYEKFQFLMVRLKGRCIYPPYRSVGLFQFLMVRLKVIFLKTVLFI